MNSLHRTRRIHFIQFTHLPFDVGQIVINKIETAKSNIVNRLLETENRLHTLDARFSLSDCETSGFSL